MLSFKKFITEEKNTHMTHAEDAIIDGGVAGTRVGIDHLRALRDMLAGNSKSSVNISVKWDGAPAVFAGTDPSDGKFFVAKKGIFNKNPKVYNHLNRMIYIYGDNIVFGVDIEILSYIGIDYNKVLTKLSKIPNCLFIDEKIFNIYRGMINKINGKVRLIPYIYEIENRNE